MPIHASSPCARRAAARSNYPRSIARSACRRWRTQSAGPALPPGVAGVLHRTDELHGSEERIDRGRVQHSAPVFGRPVNERACQSAGVGAAAMVEASSMSRHCGEPRTTPFRSRPPTPTRCKIAALRLDWPMNVKFETFGAVSGFLV